MCSGYKAGRHGCSSHYIREDVLKRIVLENISRFADFVRSYESVFMCFLEQRQAKTRSVDLKRMKRAVENNKKRIDEIDLLIEHIYEDNVKGKLTDERFMTMSRKLEEEQRSLKAETEAVESELAKEEERKTDLRLLLKIVRERTDIRELTPELVNTLIRRIEIHEPQIIDGQRTIGVDIYFTGIGMFSVPDSEELSALISEFSKHSA